MKTHLLPLCTLAACSWALGNNPDAATRAPGFGTPELDIAWDVAGDARGNVYVVGLTEGDLHGPGWGEGDAFIRKYTADRRLLWAHQFGTARPDDAQDVAVDAHGDIYVTGFTLGSLAGSHGASDLFVRKYRADGRHFWTRQLGSANQEYGTPVALAGDAVYVAGHVIDNATEQTDAFVRKLDPSGQPVWSRAFGTAEIDYVGTVAADAAGNVYVVGLTDGLADDERMTRSDLYLRKYTPAGRLAWTKRFDYGRVEMAFGVAVAGESVYLAGHFYENNPGGRDALIMKFATDGSVVWEKRFKLGGDDFVNGVSVQGEAVVVCGETVSRAGDSDGYVLRLRAGDGSEVWRTRLTTPEADIVWAVAATPAGLYAVGETAGALGDRHHGLHDAYLTRLHPGDGTTIWVEQ